MSTLLEVDLGQPNGRLSFGSVEEIRSWFNKERNFFEWVSGFRSSVHPGTWQYLCEKWGPIESAISMAEQIKERKEASLGNVINNIRSQIISAYSQSKIFLSNAPQAKFLKALKDKEVAAGALRYFLRLDLDLMKSKAAEGVFTAIMFEKGYESNIDVEKEALADLKLKAQDEIASYKKEIEKLEGQIEEIATDIKKIQTNQEKEFAEILENNIKRINALEELYKKKLSIEAPVTYWEEKRKGHRNQGIIWGILSFLGIVCLGLIIWWIISELLLSQEAVKDFSDAKRFPYWRFAITIIIVGLGVWMIRISVRIFLSHLHLNSDARERKTMITTYLAFLQEENAIKENERQIILQAIFRPSAIGMIKDDLYPPGWIEWLTRLK